MHISTALKQATIKCSSVSVLVAGLTIYGSLNSNKAGKVGDVIIFSGVSSKTVRNTLL